MAAASAKRTTKKDVYELYSKALESVQKGAYKTALTKIGQIEKGFPTEVEVLARARSLKAVCERRIEDGEKAGASGSTAEALFDRGVYHHNRDEFDTAIELFEKALKKESGAGYVYYAMAATEARQGHTDKALELLSKAIGADSANRYHAENDPDFAVLQEDDGFRELIAD